MLTLTRTLTGMPEEPAARLRGLLLRQLVRLRQGPLAEPAVRHLFLVPPAPGGTRYTLYEAVQPLVDAPLHQVQGRALSELLTARGDPRLVAGADQRWQRVDPARRGVFVGTTARFGGTGRATTIARLVDHTAVLIVVDEKHQPVDVRSTKDLVLADRHVPAVATVPGLGEPPFLLVDALVAYLRTGS
ncbi:hypothetical protein GCM10027445_21580 [Amycolatopsis endophytica]|uniref:Uncharacterized protein n=1 Tax=Amycolatopsis endophytica TaxID=860233 RepID=A0A853BEQ4_9PSEU|nr:hypothetical protein [Amycolatopsis endophytica]NYI92946.1 hypothetical protein [Amycolatopsis endophytica]